MRCVRINSSLINMIAPILSVSSGFQLDQTHPFGGRSFSFRTYWINRAGVPLDALDVTPDHIIARLTDLAPLVSTSRYPAAGGNYSNLA